MSDADRFAFARLNNKNYANDWDIRMEAILIRRGLWTDIIEVLVSKIKSDGSLKTDAEVDADLNAKLAARDVGKMAEARAEIVLRIEASQLSHMTSRNPMVIWQDLRNVHRATGFATSLARRREFLTAKKTDSETMEDWIGRVQAMVLRMEYTGIVVTPQDKILAFTMGLPATYDAVVINFDATDPDDLTVEHVISRLLNEETRQHSSRAITDSGTNGHDPSSVAFAAHRNGGPAGKDHTCYFCDKKGHFKAECPERLRWEASKARNSTETAAAIDDYEYEDYDGIW